VDPLRVEKQSESFSAQVKCAEGVSDAAGVGDPANARSGLAVGSTVFAVEWSGGGGV